jgi:hypothetical protein
LAHYFLVMYGERNGLNHIVLQGHFSSSCQLNWGTEPVTQVAVY